MMHKQCTPVTAAETVELTGATVGQVAEAGYHTRLTAAATGLPALEAMNCDKLAGSGGSDGSWSYTRLPGNVGHLGGQEIQQPNSRGQMPHPIHCGEPEPCWAC